MDCVRVAFESKSDFEYFISKEADHLWDMYTWPYYCTIDHDHHQVEFSSTFLNLIQGTHAKHNITILFGRKEPNGKDAHGYPRWKYIPFPYKIIYWPVSEEDLLTS